MNRVVIHTIPHKKQRYDTVGDYRTNGGGVVNIRISGMGDWRYEFLVALHEFVEWGLTKHQGVSEDTIDAFDMNYKGSGEPGDDFKAPYHDAHMIATVVERLMAGMLGVDWTQYNEVVDSLGLEEVKDGK